MAFFKGNFLLRRLGQIGREQEREARPVESGRGLIVVAEADVAELELVATILENLGYRVLKTQDGVTAFHLVRKHLPVLVVSSLTLPEIDGYKLSQKMREDKSTEHIPLMMITSPGETPDHVIGHESYASDYIQKPISASEFTSRISAILKIGQGEAAPPPEPSSAVEIPSADKIQEYLEEYRRKMSQNEGPKPEQQEESKASADRLEMPDIPLRTQASSLRPMEEAENYEGDPYEGAQNYVRHSIRRAEAGRAINVERGHEVVRRMIDSLAQGSDLLLSATDKTQAFSIIAHSINVAILAIRIARTLGYGEDPQSRIGLAALLHEIGVVNLPKGLTDQPEASKEELELLRLRPSYSAQIMENLGPDYEWLAQTVAQVQEREDGKGFPRGLTGDSIREEAKIIGIADVFESCIHSRPYRKALTGYESLFKLTTEGVKQFPDVIAKALIKSFSLYPYNEYVVLSSGEVGKVLDINEKNLSRPVVKILYNQDGRRLQEHKLVDLSTDTSTYITRAILPKDSVTRT
ncbi:MAG: HD domain-containing phosphohydrolase [Acidobacteriota bacterium]